MDNRNIGTYYEEQVSKEIKKMGYQILEQNYRCKGGEIDLIAKDGPYLVFMEVKYRSSHVAGYAAEAVGIKKQKVICKTALFYLREQKYSFDTPCRFDVAVIDGNQFSLLKDAFEFIR